MELYTQADAVIGEHAPELKATIDDLADRIDLAYTMDNLLDMLDRSLGGLKRIRDRSGSARIRASG